MYHTMYDHEGNMFEVTAARVRKLLALNWTFSYPEDLSTVFTNAADEKAIADSNSLSDEDSEDDEKLSGH